VVLATFNRRAPVITATKTVVAKSAKVIAFPVFAPVGMGFARLAA